MTRQMWIPTWGNRCGISEYTSYLTRYLDVEIVQEFKPSPTVDLVHVQHEYGLFDAPGRLEAYLYKCQTPHLFTEHSVLKSDKPEAFELFSNAIITHTPKQEETIKKRGIVRVERIPHGCFDLNPPQKKKAGRTVAVFGFLTEVKGFHTVAQALRDIPDVHFLLISYDLGGGEFSHYLTDYLSQHNISHTWIRDFLSVQDIMQILIEEADVLAYWYGEPEMYGASGATAIGMATGIPLIASRTSWFDGLPLYQPKNLAEGIRQLLEDEELRNSLREQQLSYCSDNSWQNIARKHELLYDEIH